MARERILSVTQDDLRLDFFRVSGAGGQHRDKTSAGCRVTHPDSGAVGTASDSRSKESNKRNAFRRMTETPEFQIWLDLQIHPENLLIEVWRNGKWVNQESLSA